MSQVNIDFRSSLSRFVPHDNDPPDGIRGVSNHTIPPTPIPPSPLPIADSAVAATGSQIVESF